MKSRERYRGEKGPGGGQADPRASQTAAKWRKWQLVSTPKTLGQPIYSLSIGMHTIAGFLSGASELWYGVPILGTPNAL